MSGLLPQRGEILLYDNGDNKQFVSVVFKDDIFWLTQSGIYEEFCKRQDAEYISEFDRQIAACLKGDKL